MDGAAVLRMTRRRAGASLRVLARKAHTSHSTLAAYESGRKEPGFGTVDRIVRSSGFDLLVELRPAVGGPDPANRGRELVDVLDLAAQFPARHDPHLDYPPFGTR